MKKYKIFITALLLMVVSFMQGISQQIVKAEYFFGPDPGVGNGVDIPISPTDSLDITFTADIIDFEPGIYSYSTRFLDENGTWSQTTFRQLTIEPLHKTGKIIAAEYFYDSDPGVGNASSIELTVVCPSTSAMTWIGVPRLSSCIAKL